MDATSTAIAGGITSAIGYMDTAFDAIVSNPVCIVFLGVMMLGVGLKVFRKIKGAAR